MSRSAYLLFDVESVPDADLLNDVKYRDMGLTPAKALALAEREAIKEYGNNFLPYTFQFPVAVAVMWLDKDFQCQRCAILPEYTTAEDEAERIYDDEGDRLRGLVVQFWRHVEAQQLKLVSFNGRTFDLPLLELHGFKYGTTMRSHFTEKYGARYRFGDAHIDVQEFMTNFGASRLAGGLNLLSHLLGRDGKGAIAGDQVADLYVKGEQDAINTYCLHDVLETYCAFLRTRVLVGALARDDEAGLVSFAQQCVAAYQPPPAP